MAFYRKRATYQDYAPLIVELQKFMRSKFPLIPREELEERGWTEAFLVDYKDQSKVMQDFYSQWGILAYGGYIDAVPMPQGYRIVYWRETTEGPLHTVSPSHVRLPKLSYLITLTPEDFFTCMRLIATAKNTPMKDALALNPPAAGINNLAVHNLAPFFMLLKVNYRINPEYADKKWTPREAIAKIATLPPTRDNQLSAMQYLTALQNPDLLYFPVETVIELELDWEQVSDEYCVPPDAPSNPLTLNVTPNEVYHGT